MAVPQMESMTGASVQAGLGEEKSKSKSKGREVGVRKKESAAQTQRKQSGHSPVKSRPHDSLAANTSPRATAERPSFASLPRKFLCERMEINTRRCYGAARFVWDGRKEPRKSVGRKPNVSDETAWDLDGGDPRLQQSLQDISVNFGKDFRPVMVMSWT
ncbi:hypothetical protein C8R44DRAFT_736949 [Mycena epipterygia]|nr:hypothetical protein C8R44DRAFT_736949 [Mycena epipterygia]